MRPSVAGEKLSWKSETQALVPDAALSGKNEDFPESGPLFRHLHIERLS